MGVKQLEVYNILSNVCEISEAQISRLIDVYGKNVVSDVVKMLVIEDKNNLERFSKYSWELALNLVDEGVILDNYYIEDSNVLDSTNDNVLLGEIVQIIKCLNELFILAGCRDDILGKNRKPWICDKIEFCVKQCSDISLLNNIKSKYEEYVIKRNKLIERHLNFVIMAARKYVKKDELLLCDLIQYGNIGMIRAIETYNPDFNVKFLTYADAWINQMIRFNVKRNRNDIKLPMYLFDLNKARLGAVDYLTLILGKNPSNSEVANYMGLSLEKIERIIGAFTEPISLDEPAPASLDEIGNFRIDFVADETVSVQEEVFKKCMSDDLNKVMLETLTEREIFILRNRFGFDGDMTLDELAAILNISYQRVLQLQNKALTKLYRNPKVSGMISYLR